MVQRGPESAAAVATSPSNNTVLVNVQCPQSSRPGDSFEITVEGAQYNVRVPPGVGPGQIFRVNIPAHPQQQPVRAVAAAPAPPPSASAAPPAAAVTAYPAAMTHDGRPTAYVPEATVVPASAQQQQPQASAAPHFFAEPSAKPVPPGSTGKAGAAASVAEANPFGDEATSEANPFADDDDVTDPHAWVIAPFKAEFDAAFQAAGPSGRSGGLPPALSPAQVKALLMPTGLPKESLRAVWELSDLDKDGVLDADEFAVAMYLCRQAQNGEAVPKVLPDNVVPPSKRNPF